MITRGSRWLVAILLVGTTGGHVRPAAAGEATAFDIHVSLSDKAAAALAAKSEAIVVLADYSAAPKPSAQKHADQIGRIDLGDEQVEIAGKPGIAPITGSQFKTGRLPWIEGPVLLNVNVASARKSGPDNLLTCDFFDGELANAVAAHVTLHCALIEENTQTKQKS